MVVMLMPLLAQAGNSIMYDCALYTLYNLQYRFYFSCYVMTFVWLR